MGNNLFKAGISKAIRNAFRGKLLSAVLTKVTPTTRTTGSVVAGTNPTSVSHACEGFIDSKEKNPLTGTLVADGFETIVLIGDSLPSGVVPAIGDQLTIEGTVYVLGEDSVIDRDPDAATYTLKVRTA